MPRTGPSLIAIFTLLILLLLETLSGQPETTVDGSATQMPANQLSKMQTRKALVEGMQDYDYAVHNSRHELKRGKPGNWK